MVLIIPIKYPNLIIYNDHKSLIKDSKVKAVAIATPAATHYSIAKEALLAGKDVFVEKPIALNYKEGEELVASAKDKNRVLMVGHILEYHPAIIKLKKIINKGDLGKINYIFDVNGVPNYIITIPKRYIKTNLVDPDSEYKVTLSLFKTADPDKIQKILDGLDERLALGEITQEKYDELYEKYQAKLKK